MCSDNPHATVDAVLMASGFSRRFGTENKLLSPFHGKPLALHTLQLICALPGISCVYFVYADEAVGRLANGLPVVKIHNENPQLGQRESVRLGILGSSADYYAFFPCDTPLLTKKTIEAVLAAKAPGKIAFPLSSDTPGNPAVFSACFREELLSLCENETAKIIKQRHPESLIPVSIADADQLADIDTKTDLANLLHAKTR